MKRTTLAGLAFVVLLLGVMVWPGGIKAQTAHGIQGTWNTATVPTGGAAIAGYNLWWAQCPGGVCGAFVQYNSSLITTTSILIPTTSLQTNTEYGFYLVTQDVNGGLSAPSAPMTGQSLASGVITTPSTWPVNPNPPTGCGFKIV